MTTATQLVYVAHRQCMHHSVKQTRNAPLRVVADAAVVEIEGAELLHHALAAPHLAGQAFEELVGNIVHGVTEEERHQLLRRVGPLPAGHEVRLGPQVPNGRLVPARPVRSLARVVVLEKL